jgi:hypothetical protein
MKIRSHPFLVALLAPVSLGSICVAAACSSSTHSGSNDGTGAVDAAHDDAATNSTDAATDAGASEAAASDGALESGSEDGASDDAAEAAPAPTCGAPPARYTVLTGANAGLVRDNVTELVWMADSEGGGEPPQTQPDAATYCTGRGMRLPTEAEALALAAAYAPCAFGQWSTWTSTAAGTGDAWVVDYFGDASPQVADNFPSAVLCVRDGSGD